MLWREKDLQEEDVIAIVISRPSFELESTINYFEVVHEVGRWCFS